VKRRLVKTFFYTATSLSAWLMVIISSSAFVIIGKHSILLGLGYGLLMFLGFSTLIFIFGIPKKTKPCEIMQEQNNASLYDDVEICGKKLNIGLRLEQTQQSNPYNW